MFEGECHQNLSRKYLVESSKLEKGYQVKRVSTGKQGNTGEFSSSEDGQSKSGCIAVPCTFLSEFQTLHPAVKGEEHKC